VHYHYFTIEQREALERAIRARAARDAQTAVLLQRLHAPDYGVCARCGADIAYTILAEDPAATLCRACAH
jgi:RNA polymerase-binding transcription factor DksA